MVRCVLQIWWRRSSRSCSDSCLSMTLSGEALSLYSSAMRTRGHLLPAFDLLIKGFVPCYYLLFMVLKMAACILHTKASASSPKTNTNKPERCYSMVAKTLIWIFWLRVTLLRWQLMHVFIHWKKVISKLPGFIQIKKYLASLSQPKYIILYQQN